MGAAALVAVSAVVTFALAWSAITSSYESIMGARFNPAPTHSPCVNTTLHPQPAHSSAFWAHMTYMSFAFGFCAPLGAICYTLARDALGLSQRHAKMVHGMLMLGLLVGSILGFQQIYYAHGANCHDADGAKHFQSLHSYIGIFVLTLVWFQWPAAFAIFSNTKLLVPGTRARLRFVSLHRFLGTASVAFGLLTIVTGTLAFEGKRKVPSPTTASSPAWWFAFVRTGTAAFVTLVLYVWYLFESKGCGPLDEATKVEDQALVVALEPGEEAVNHH